MGIQEDLIIEKQADDFMKKEPAQRERLLYMAVMRTDVIVSKMLRDGCDKACPQSQSIVHRWTPAALSTLIVSVLVGILEYVRGNK